MKQNLHPNYHHDTKVTCACGNTFITGSILPEINVPICSKCHPFWTGAQKFIDTEGRVEKFMRLRKQAQVTAAKKPKKKKRVKEDGKEERPKTLREMLESTR
ncbi:MAG: 50S ribosomal protein L31 [Candidatus Cloacimonetes bacterium]|nr:50S ribosomal protein L31 [Candidatus Cloacimonadota bacterium]